MALLLLFLLCRGSHTAVAALAAVAAATAATAEAASAGTQTRKLGVKLIILISTLINAILCLFFSGQHHYYSTVPTIPTMESRRGIPTFRGESSILDARINTYIS